MTVGGRTVAVYWPRKVAHTLTIAATGEDLAYRIDCPCDPDDTDKQCSLLIECDCNVDDPDETPECPESPLTGEHRYAVSGFLGAPVPGCWLQVADTLDAVEDLRLPVGRYLVTWENESDGSDWVTVIPLATIGDKKAR